MKYFLIDVTHPLQFFLTGKSMLAEDWMHYERTIDHFILYVTISGAFHLNVRGERKSLYPGDVLLMEPNAHHVGFKPAAVTFYWLHFQSNNIQVVENDRSFAQMQAAARDKLVMPAHFRLPHVENFIILINQLIHNFKDIPKSYFNDYLATAILLELQRQATANKPLETPGKNRRFEEILAYIDGNYREDLYVSRIAEQFGYNEKYLVRLFQKQTGTTIKGYIINTRLKMAEMLLLNTSDPIAVIAQKSGFTNEYYFMRRFKQKYNMSPSQYRNTYYLQVMSKY